MKRLITFVELIAVCLILTVGAKAQKRETQNPSSRETSQRQQSKEKAATMKYVSVHKYDPSRNAEQDIRDAISEAERTGKRILLAVGGEWCIWCHIMDSFFEKHPELLALREKNFITLKINFSEENKNEEVLSRYPAISSYPHIFVLDRDGKHLHSQETGVLEVGKSYDLATFTAFLKEWSPPSNESPR